MNNLIPKFLPGVALQLSLIMQLVHSAIGELHAPPRHFPHPSTLGIRTSEHLSYGTFEQGLNVHTDSGSVFTLLFILSDPEDYDGGEFFIRHETLGTETLIKPARLNAVVFLSDLVVHGVKPIPRGERETFATEFWIYPDVPPPHTRPEHVGWELYIDRLKVDLNADFPELDEISEFRESGRSIWTGDKGNSEYGIDDGEVEEL